MKEDILRIEYRDSPEPHYEIHYANKVEFRTLGNKKLGVSKVHKVNSWWSRLWEKIGNAVTAITFR
jgi:hypothetical protein